MSKNTCGNCPSLGLNKTRLMTVAYCEKTDEVIPHEWCGYSNTITLWRVPVNCTQEGKMPSEKQAPRKDWVVIDLSK